MLDLQSSRRVGHEWVGVEGRAGAAPVLDASRRVEVAAGIAVGDAAEAGTAAERTLVEEVGRSLGCWRPVEGCCPCATEACNSLGHRILEKQDRSLVDLDVAYIAVALVAGSYIAVPVGRHLSKMEMVEVVRGMRVEEAEGVPLQCSKSHLSYRDQDVLGRTSADHLDLGKSTSLTCLA